MRYIACPAASVMKARRAAVLVPVLLVLRAYSVEVHWHPGFQSWQF
jgi:hypothetical protein